MQTDRLISRQAALLQQLVLVPLFWLLASFSYPGQSSLCEYSAPDLLQMLPGIFSRYQIASLLGAVALLLFFGLIYPRLPALARENSASPRMHWWIILGLSAFLYLLLFTRLLQYPVSTDDAFQNYRYIHNWIAGTGLAYNPGERTLGFTSILNMAVLFSACFFFDPADIPVVSQVLSTIWQAGTFLLLFVLLRETLESNGLALTGSVLYVTSTLVLHEAMTGKESSLLMLLIVLSLLLLHRRNYRGFAWAGALICLTRPEGIIWLLVAAAWLAIKRPPVQPALWIGPASLVAACYALIWLEFGTIVPRGAVARLALPIQLQNPFQHAVPYIFNWLGEYTFQGIIRSFCSPLIGIYFAYALQGLVVFVLLAYALPENKWLNFYSYEVVWLIGFFSLADPRSFSWYYAWFAILPIFLVVLLLKYEFALLRSTRSLPARALIILLVVFQIGNYVTTGARATTKSSALRPEPAITASAQHRIYMPVEIEEALQFQWLGLKTSVFKWLIGDERLVLYTRAVDAVRATNPERGSEIGVQEPGIVGFYGHEFRILDLSGLLSESALKYYPVPLNARPPGIRLACTPPNAVQALKPDYLITFGIFVNNGLLKNEYFLSHYRLIAFWPLRIWTPFTHGLYLFQKVSG